MRATWIVLLFAILSWMTGCAWLGPGIEIDASSSRPNHTVIGNVPFFPQKAYQCGPAAMAMVMAYRNIAVQPEDLVPIVYTPERKGSLQTGLITASRRYGLLAYPFSDLNCLLDEVAAGRPVIVLQNLGLNWIPKWHYAVVIGYDLSESAVILHTGVAAHRRVGLRTFMKTWERADKWALVSLPVTEMPVCATATAYIQSVLGLERAGFKDEVLFALREAAQRWPRDTNVRVALGNAQYSNRMLAAAAKSYRRAIAHDPTNAPALNNLAHTLAELGALEEAESMARRAIALGGPFMDLYRSTLDEILQRQGVLNPPAPPTR